MNGGVLRRVFAGVLMVGSVWAWGQTTPPAGPSQAVTLVEPRGPLVPTNDRLVGDGSGNAPGTTPEQATILKEDGLVRSESRTVVVPVAGGTKAVGWLTAYQFGDATGAYSAYTYFRGGAKKFTQFKLFNSTEVQLPDEEIVFLSGINVVRAQIRQTPEAVSALLHSIETGLPKVSGRKALAPLLPTMFPADVAGTRLDPETLHYALGPLSYQAMGGVLPPEILGWDKSAEVATASYAGRGGKGTLTLLLYPTPQVAGDRGRAVEKAINDKGTPSFGTVKMRRVGPLVGVTSGGLTAEQAEKLVQALHLDEIVTFDKKMPLEFHVEVRKTATLLQSIAIFTGILILASLVIAVFLGGARAGIRVLRGKPAASEPEFLTINLRDKPKALFAPKNPDGDSPPA